MTGFTPAYAGNTCRKPCTWGGVEVHPRIRGEYSMTSGSGRRRPGSPPHTRGIPPRRCSRAKSGGFTPAYAGNTNLLQFLPLGRWVHPRIRGEYLDPLQSLRQLRGSPPHTRGILFRLSINAPLLRFTPAYAGNTEFNPADWDWSEVHPRIRGEYSARALWAIRRMGSPPHTRGIHRYLHPMPASKGFTPAYAGNTLRIAIACGSL